jgi:O-acetyl-ADP-ribose deacetylase (regulator of RNase III)
MLAVIGSAWLTHIESDSDSPVPGDATDSVILDITEALKRNIPIIPILVDNTRMPPESALPKALALLTSSLPPLPLNHRSVEKDVDRIAQEISRLVPELRSHRGRKRALTHTETRIFRLKTKTINDCRIGVITGDIRDVRWADIWVNGENTDMEMARIPETSISAIIRGGGAQRDQEGKVISDLIADELESLVGAVGPVPPATAFVTGSGALRISNNVRYVVHVAAVEGKPAAGFRQVRNVGHCVTNALNEAEHLAVRDPLVKSILFPILGTGEGRGDVRTTILTLLEAAIEYLDTMPETAMREIYFLAYFNVELDEFMDFVHHSPRLIDSR